MNGQQQERVTWAAAVLAAFLLGWCLHAPHDVEPGADGAEVQTMPGSGR